MFKKKFFAEVFYARLGVETELTRKFGKLFPNVRHAIRYFKQDDYRDLPLRMQETEATLMIGVVCSKLSDLGLPFLPVHDSILTTSDHVEQVEAIIKNSFAEVGLHPTISKH